MSSDEQMLTTNGEVTGQQLFKVRGDPHWSSTPAIAKRIHAVLKKAEAEGYTKRKENK